MPELIIYFDIKQIKLDEALEILNAAKAALPNREIVMFPNCVTLQQFNKEELYELRNYMDALIGRFEEC